MWSCIRYNSTPYEKIMKDNSIFVTIEGKTFLVDEITISDAGKVEYTVYCSKGELTKEDDKNIADFVRTLLSQENS